MQATRRIVTGHDDQGKAVVLFEGVAPNMNQRRGGNVLTMLWVTDETPAGMEKADGPEAIVFMTSVGCHQTARPDRHGLGRGKNPAATCRYSPPPASRHACRQPRDTRSPDRLHSRSSARPRSSLPVVPRR